MESGGSDEKCLSGDFNSEENDSFELEENLWKRMKDDRFKDGYKDGTFVGNEHALQKGFHFGYQQTIKQLYQMSKLKSAIEAAKEWICTPETGEELEHEYILLDKEFSEDWKSYVEHLKCANLSPTEESDSGSDAASLSVERSEKLCENQASSASVAHDPLALHSLEAASSEADAKGAKTRVSDQAADERRTVDLAAEEEESISRESIAAGLLLALKSEHELNKAVLDSMGMAIFNKYLQRLEQMLGKSNI